MIILIHWKERDGISKSIKTEVGCSFFLLFFLLFGLLNTIKSRQTSSIQLINKSLSGNKIFKFDKICFS